ncbi:MAG TPA: hypothetical protein VH374_03330 [Polyangia bacterium]|nr:hypothetical protein [Polyangia bacterium]
MEVSASARSLSRLLLMVGGLTYTGWHWFHIQLEPNAVDPLRERLGFLVLTVVLVLLSYRRALKRHLISISYVVVVVGTAHYFSLVARNDISTPYLVGVFVVLGAVSTLLLSPRASIIYALATVLMATLVAALATHAPLEDRIELLAGTSTIQLGMGVSAWRNMILQGTARELEAARQQLRQLRGLLPICMHCNRIRDQGNHWEQFESYVEAHTDASFTHSLCRECADKHYPGA